MQTSAITVETVVHAPLGQVWDFWTKPEHVVNWAFASDDWEAPHAENDLRTGGAFVIVIAAKDKSASFDFAGVYTNILPQKLIEYKMEDRREVRVEFAETPVGIRVVETFDPENINSAEMQRAGWQGILDNFKKYVESNSVIASA